MGYKTIMKQVLLYIIKKALKALWNYMDKNKDGSINKVELKQVYNEIKDLIPK